MGREYLVNFMIMFFDAKLLIPIKVVMKKKFLTDNRKNK